MFKNCHSHVGRSPCNGDGGEISPPFLFYRPVFRKNGFILEYSPEQAVDTGRITGYIRKGEITVFLAISEKIPVSSPFERGTRGKRRRLHEGQN